MLKLGRYPPQKIQSSHLNKHPASNKRPHPSPLTQTQISAHPHPTHLSDNEIEIKIE